MTPSDHRVVVTQLWLSFPLETLPRAPSKETRPNNSIPGETPTRMSAIETTPNSSRFATQSQNSRTHSVRTATTSALDDQLPPARPVFLESALFINALAGPSRQPPALGVKNANGATSVPMQTTRVDGRSLGSAALPPGVGKDSKAGAAPPTRKRTVADAIDRENLHVAPVAGDERANKRLRANAGDMTMLAAASVTADAITAKRKQRKIDRGAGIEKLQQDTQQWRQKYRKAFPSFTFYFDAIDEATQLTLGVAVKRLGAVCWPSHSGLVFEA